MFADKRSVYSFFEGLCLFCSLRQLFEPLAKTASLAEGVAKFVLCKTFADVSGEGRVYDFGKALFGDVSERNLSAMVEAASDYSIVMKNRNVSV